MLDSLPNQPSGGFLTRPQSVRLRRALFQVHLWTGIALGLYVLAISLSGSVIVYRRELDKVFAARTIIVAPHGQRLSDAQLLAAARAAYPDRHFDAIQIRGSRVPNAAVEVWYLFGGGRLGRGRIERLFDPYSGVDLGATVMREPAAISWIAELHDSLLAGAMGFAINGAGALLLTLMCLTGAVLWWPGRARWRRSLVLRRGVGWRRFTWDLHSVLGFWVLLLVLLWSVTGIYLAFPYPFDALIEGLSGNGAPTAASRGVDHAIDWLVQLHFGRSFGPWVKALWAILGLVPGALFVTGALMWWNRVLRRAIGAFGEPVASPAGGLPRCDQRKGPAPVQTIEVKVPVERPDAGFGLQLRHPHQASIGEGHGAVTVAPHELPYSAMLPVEVEICAQKAGLDQRKQIVGVMTVALEQEERLRNDSFAGCHGCGSVTGLFDRPGVLRVITDEQCDNGAGVD
jgi:hypothetical protein